MDIAWLLDFIALSRTLNFTRAAEERHVTQSAFSRRIKSLEQWVGAGLIDRSAYPIRLLPAGEEFLPVAQAVARDLLESRDALRARAPDGAKFQTFAAPHAVSTHCLSPMLRSLQGKQASMRTRVLSDDLHTCCRLLTEGASDFLVCYRHPAVPLMLDEARFERIDFGNDSLLPVCVPAGSGQACWTLPGAGRARVPVLAYAPGSYFGAVVEHVLAGQRAHLHVRHIDAFAEALKTLALLGHGVAWLPRVAVTDALQTGRLQAAGDARWQAEMTVSAFAARKRLDGEGQQLWDALREIARTGPVPADGTPASTQ